MAFFLDSLDGVVTWLVDGVAGIALLAGGVVCFPALELIIWIPNRY